VKARPWWGELAKGEIDVHNLALLENISASYVTSVVRVAFLAAEFVDVILAGTLRAEIGAAAPLETGVTSGC